MAGKEGGSAEGSGEAPPQGLVSPEAEERLQETPELDYLTHIVMRLFENKRCGACSLRLRTIVVEGDALLRASERWQRYAHRNCSRYAGSSEKIIAAVLSP